MKKLKSIWIQNGTDLIYSPYPTVGYLNDTMKEIEKNKRLKFEFFNFNWDQLFWPHAKKGFFKLKKQIKDNNQRFKSS